MKKINDCVVFKGNNNYYLIDNKNEKYFNKAFKLVEDKENFQEITRKMYSIIWGIDVPECVCITNKKYDGNMFYDLRESELVLQFDMYYYNIPLNELRIYDHIEHDNRDRFMDYYYELIPNIKYNKDFKIKDVLDLSKDELIELMKIEYEYSDDYISMEKYKSLLIKSFPDCKIELIYEDLKDMFRICFNDGICINVDYWDKGYGYTCACEYSEKIKDVQVHVLGGFEERSIKEILWLHDNYNIIKSKELIGVRDLINHIEKVNPDLYYSRFRNYSEFGDLTPDEENQIEDVLKFHYKINEKDFSPVFDGYYIDILQYIK